MRDGERCANGERRIERRCPVGLHPIVQGVLQQISEERQDARRQQGRGLVAFRHGVRDDSPQADDAEHGNDRARKRQVGPRKLQDVGRGQALVGGNAAELLGKRGPAVLGVPDHDGQRKTCCERAASPELPAPEPMPVRGQQDQPRDNAGPDEQVAVLGDEPEAGEQADCQPPVGTARDVQLGERPAGEPPEQHGGRIGRNQHTADRQQRHGERKPHGALCHLAAKENVRGAPQQERPGQRRQHGAEPDAERVVACDRPARRDHPAHHRRMVEIGERRRQPPQPVVGLVLRQRHERGHQSVHARHRHDGECQQHGAALEPAPSCNRRLDASADAR